MSGEELREIRRRLGLTQAALATRLGVTQNTVGRWERSEVPVPQTAKVALIGLANESNTVPALAAARVVIRDPHHKAIIDRLNRKLDPEVFEACAADLLRRDWPGLVPIPGGSDDGYDGSIPTVAHRPFPLVTTTSGDPKGNLSKNLKRAIDSGWRPRRAIFGTSRNLTSRLRKELFAVAEQLHVKLEQVYDQSWFANALYREPSWCKKLLGLTGRPSPISIFPLSSRPVIGQVVIGRDEELEKLRRMKLDSVVVGVPGIGKTFALRALALEGYAHFLVDSDREALANAIREQGPKAIIVDDAQTDLTTLSELSQLRKEIAADFRIIAVTWPTHAEAVTSALNLAKSDVVSFQPFDRDVMVEVVKSGGVSGPNQLIRFIVDQAEGRPGLAATLAYLCRRGDIDEVVSGESLARQLGPVLENLVGPKATILLGAFALGGASGVAHSLISDFLEIPKHELGVSLARLAAAGVVRDHPGGIVSVHPESLRWILVKKTFFSGAGSIEFESLYRRLSNRAAGLSTLIGARSRGAAIRTLEELLNEENSAELWRMYAWLGRAEANFVLETHPEHLTKIVEPALEYSPQKTIPQLLERSIGDQRPRNSTLEHPLRKIEDWATGSFPGTSDVFERRQNIVHCTEKWAPNSRDLSIAVEAICIAFEPGFYLVESDPGRGKNVTFSSGLMYLGDLQNLARLWPRAKSILEQIQVPCWKSLFSLIHKWLHPHVASGIPKETRLFMQLFAEQIIEDLTNLSLERPGVQHKLAELTQSASIEATGFRLNPYLEILYPFEDYKGGKDQLEKWAMAARKLAVNWTKDSVSKIAFRISSIEAEAELAGLNYPRFSPALCTELAQHIAQPVEMAQALILAGTPKDLVRPFMKRASLDQDSDWQAVVNDCLKDTRYATVAAEIGITSAHASEDLIAASMPILEDYPGIVETACLLGEVPDRTLRILLRSESGTIATATAIGIWHYRKDGPVSTNLHADWKEAVLNAESDFRVGSREAYWLGEILTLDFELGKSWMIRHLGNLHPLFGNSPERLIRKIVGALDQIQKIEILHSLDGERGQDKSIEILVGDDLELYSQLLSSTRLAAFHLSPLRGRIDLNWPAMATLALDAGYSIDEVGDASRWSSWTWSGPLSAMWQQRIEEFQELVSDSDHRIVEIARREIEELTKVLQDQLERERMEAIYGD